MLDAPVTVDPTRPQKTQTPPSGGGERSRAARLRDFRLGEELLRT